MLPTILAALGASAIGAYLFFGGDKAKAETVAKPLIPPHPTGGELTLANPGDSVVKGGVRFTVIAPPPGPPIVNGGPLIAQGKTPGGNAILGLHNLNDLGPTFANSAISLSDYLHANGLDGSPGLKMLVSQFQKNARANKVGYADAMLQDGVYDLPTSAALTIAIGQPIAPDTQGKPFASYPFSVTTNPDGSNAASASATNLWSYLRAHGNDHSPMLAAFTKQFQHDVNTDPRFPGPAALGAAKQVQKFKAKIKEDGVFGKDTTVALKVYGMAI